MGKFAVGQVISSAFPFSDLTARKFRPALVVAVGDFEDLILCQITSKAYSSSNPIKLISADFVKGSLPVDSFVRPDKLFTTDASIVSRIYGELEPAKTAEILAAIRAIFSISRG